MVRFPGDIMYSSDGSMNQRTLFWNIYNANWRLKAQGKWQNLCIGGLNLLYISINYFQKNVFMILQCDWLFLWYGTFKKSIIGIINP
jgi:hypothetical protein